MDISAALMKFLCLEHISRQELRLEKDEAAEELAELGWQSVSQREQGEKGDGCPRRGCSGGANFCPPLTPALLQTC